MSKSPDMPRLPQEGGSYIRGTDGALRPADAPAPVPPAAALADPTPEPAPPPRRDAKQPVKDA